MPPFISDERALAKLVKAISTVLDEQQCFED
jgi:hypothetical protein